MVIRRDLAVQGVSGFLVCFFFFSFLLVINLITIVQYLYASPPSQVVATHYFVGSD